MVDVARGECISFCCNAHFNWSLPQIGKGLNVTRPEDWFTVGILGFLGGVVSNIIVPLRRGVLGFISAAMVGVFCGGVAGIVANSFEVHYGIQYGTAAMVGVMGDRILTALMQWRLTRGQTTIHNYGPTQQQFGNNNDQEQDKK